SAEVRPCALFCGVERASHVCELRAWRDLREPVEHAACADRGELRAVADRDELRACPLDGLGEPIEPVRVDHRGLVEVDRRVLANLNAPVLHASDEGIYAERLSGEGGAVSS